jgi:hypothetical protein
VFKKLKCGLRVSDSREKAGGICSKAQEGRIKKLALECGRANRLAKEADAAVRDRIKPPQLLSRLVKGCLLVGQQEMMEVRVRKSKYLGFGAIKDYAKGRAKGGYSVQNEGDVSVVKERPHVIKIRKHGGFRAATIIP